MSALFSVTNPILKPLYHSRYSEVTLIRNHRLNFLTHQAAFSCVRRFTQWASPPQSPFDRWGNGGSRGGWDTPEVAQPGSSGVGGDANVNVLCDLGQGAAPQMHLRFIWRPHLEGLDV